MAAFAVTEQQKNFFRTFGYIHFKGLFADSVDEIIKAFHDVWESRNHQHDGKTRSALVPFIDRHERLCALLDDPRFVAVGEGLLGPGFNYLTSDGNYYVGDTNWHCDSWHENKIWMKTAFYLDPLTRNTGALRIIPGSHLPDRFRGPLGDMVVKPQENLGLHGRDIPAAALETQPGDLVCFNHTALHASYGGSTQRRMFTIDLCERSPDNDTQELKDYLAIFAKKGLERMYGPKMISTAGPKRMRHLEQVMANDSHMAAIAAEVKKADSGAYSLT